MSANNILEVHHLIKRVGQGEHELTILQGVELIVESGQTIALIGESGSGKSTLLGIIAGLDDGSSGTVNLLGQDLTKMDEEQRARLRAQSVGFVFQSFMLIPTLNAIENVQLPSLLRGESESESYQHAASLLTDLGLKDRLKHMPHSCQGGSNSVLHLLVPLMAAHRFYLLMNQREISIATPGIKLQIYCLI